MKKLSQITAIVLLVATLASCKQQQARMPVSRSSGTFMKESVERNKKLIAGEESKIESVIKKDAKSNYIATAKGYWYKYDIKSTSNDSITPKKGKHWSLQSPHHFAPQAHTLRFPECLRA